MLICHSHASLRRFSTPLLNAAARSPSSTPARVLSSSPIATAILILTATWPAPPFTADSLPYPSTYPTIGPQSARHVPSLGCFVRIRLNGSHFLFDEWDIIDLVPLLPRLLLDHIEEEDEDEAVSVFIRLYA